MPVTKISVLIYGKDKSYNHEVSKRISLWEADQYICDEQEGLSACLADNLYDLIFILGGKNVEEIKRLADIAHTNNSAASICVVSEVSEINEYAADFQCIYSDLENERFLFNIYHQVQQKKMQAELSAMLIHDLRSPMQSLMNYLELIENEVFGEINDGQQKMISHALSLSEDLQELVEGLSRIYQYEQKSYTLSKEKTSLKSLIDMTLPALWVLADKKNIKFIPPVIGDLPPVYIDVQAIYRVVVNLVSNAINHSPEDSVVRLDVIKIEKSGQPTTIQFKVIDSGTGIEASQMNYIFDKFYRVENSVSKKKGYGLGLYISKLIVEAHGGKIGAFNNREGGMTFYFSLPVVN